jgi:hypothetical protein
MVGFIEEYKSGNDQIFNEAILRLATDFNRLYHVYVIENMNRNELIELSEKVAEDNE